MFELLYQSLAEVKNPDEVNRLLNDLITPTERVMLAKRLSIAVLLAKNYDYRQISFVLKVSYATIAHVVATFRLSGEGFKAFVQKLARREEFQELIDDIGRFLIKAAYPKKRWPEKKRTFL